MLHVLYIFRGRFFTKNFRENYETFGSIFSQKWFISCSIRDTYTHERYVSLILILPRKKRKKWTFLKAHSQPFVIFAILWWRCWQYDVYNGYQHKESSHPMFLNNSNHSNMQLGLIKLIWCMLQKQCTLLTRMKKYPVCSK